MTPGSAFEARLRRPAAPGEGPPWAFVLLPESESARLPRRGRTTVDGHLNGHPFRATLDPDGRRGHWLRVDQHLLDAAGLAAGDSATLSLNPVAEEPEPGVPADLRSMLKKAPDAAAVWNATTAVARLDWIHWLTSAKQAGTRLVRVDRMRDMLASGHRRVCCFDPSGVYSKALRPPDEADPAD